MNIDSVQMRRLAFVKFLYRHGQQLLRQPEPLACSSLLLFHDAAELFLDLACEVHAAGQPKEFKAYWGALNQKLAPASVSEREGMLKLNSARVALKHYGHMHNRLSLDSYADTMRRFFNDNTKTLFQLSFAEVSLVELVFPENARRELQEAVSALGADERAKAASHVALAFQMTIDDFESKRRDRFGRSPFFFGKRLDSISEKSIVDCRRAALGSTRHREAGSQLDMRQLGKAIDALSSTTQDMQSALKIIALGVDFRKYSRFRYLTPNVRHNIGGECIVHDLPEGQGDALNHEELAFCIDFVIETSLLLQESEGSTGSGLSFSPEVLS